jgi:ABC-type dipeptide/oligopeptide/nickel transport system permease component
MAAYWLGRLARTLLVVLFITAVVFILLRLSGDPVALLLGQDATPERIAEVRARLGLDQPLSIQFGRYLLDISHGDFGTSLAYGSPAIGLLADRFPNTVVLSVAGLFVAIVPAIGLGLLGAVRRGTKLDSLILGFSTLGQALPSFWLGIMLVLLFSVELHLLPTSGREGPESIVLPALTLSSIFVGRFTLMLRASLIEVLQQDYVRTARSKGLGQRVILYRHALRNALLPFVTIVGLSFGQLLGGAVITETVFAWPGVGFLAVQAVNNRDFALVQASVVVLAFCVVACNLVVDLLYPILDPRIASS